MRASPVFFIRLRAVSDPTHLRKNKRARSAEARLSKRSQGGREGAVNAESSGGTMASSRPECVGVCLAPIFSERSPGLFERTIGQLETPTRLIASGIGTGRVICGGP